MATWPAPQWALPVVPLDGLTRPQEAHGSTLYHTLPPAEFLLEQLPTLLPRPLWLQPCSKRYPLYFCATGPLVRWLIRADASQ